MSAFDEYEDDDDLELKKRIIEKVFIDGEDPEQLSDVTPDFLDDDDEARTELAIVLCKNFEEEPLLYFVKYSIRYMSINNTLQLVQDINFGLRNEEENHDDMINKFIGAYKENIDNYYKERNVFFGYHIDKISKVDLFIEDLKSIFERSVYGSNFSNSEYMIDLYEEVEENEDTNYNIDLVIKNPHTVADNILMGGYTLNDDSRKYGEKNPKYIAGILNSLATKLILKGKSNPMSILQQSFVRGVVGFPHWETNIVQAFKIYNDKINEINEEEGEFSLLDSARVNWMNTINLLIPEDLKKRLIKMAPLIFPQEHQEINRTRQNADLIEKRTAYDLKYEDIFKIYFDRKKEVLDLLDVSQKLTQSKAENHNSFMASFTGYFYQTIRNEGDNVFKKDGWGKEIANQSSCLFKYLTILLPFTEKEAVKEEFKNILYLIKKDEEFEMKAILDNADLTQIEQYVARSFRHLRKEEDLLKVKTSLVLINWIVAITSIIKDALIKDNLSPTDVQKEKSENKEYANYLKKVLMIDYLNRLWG